MTGGGERRKASGTTPGGGRAGTEALRSCPRRGMQLIGRTMKTLPFLLAAASLIAGPLHAETVVSPPVGIVPAGAVKNVSPDDAAKLLKDNPKIVVLDVRTPEEFAAGHIAGAKNVDFRAADFAAKVAALDRKQTYLVHCASGGRSGKSLELMKGFTAVYHLNEGFKAWEKAGKPVTK